MAVKVAINVYVLLSRIIHDTYEYIAEKKSITVYFSHVYCRLTLNIARIIRRIY